MSAGGSNLIIMLAYMIGVLGIGYFAWKRAFPGIEDFFLARRGFGTLVLLASLFGTLMTAFVMVGAPGLAYHGGYSTLGYAAGGMGMMIPLSTFLVGYRLWAVGKRYGYMTPAEAFGDRWSSRAIKWVMFVLFIVYLIPYIQLGAVGGGRVLSVMTKGIVPYWLGCIIPIAIVFIYVYTGGMRGTAWTNVFQTAVFLGMLVAAFFIVANGMGGFADATAALNAKKISLAGKGPFVWKRWFSFSLVLMAGGGMYPHMMLRLMSSVSDKALKRMWCWFPLCVGITWTAAVYLGVWGSAVFPNLVGAASDNILPMLVTKFAPAVVVGILGAGMLAAIMSSTDAQFLTCSTMLTRDVIVELKPQIEEGTQVNLGKWLVAFLCVVAIVLAIIQPIAIIKLGEMSFTGFVCMMPAGVAALWWKRATKWGALASLIVSAILLPFYFFGGLGASKWASFGGFLPVVPCLTISIILVVVISLLSPPPPQDKVEKWWDGCFRKFKD